MRVYNIKSVIFCKFFKFTLNIFPINYRYITSKPISNTSDFAFPFDHEIRDVMTKPLQFISKL